MSLIQVKQVALGDLALDGMPLAYFVIRRLKHPYDLAV